MLWCRLALVGRKDSTPIVAIARWIPNLLANKGELIVKFGVGQASRMRYLRSTGLRKRNSNAILLSSRDFCNGLGLLNEKTQENGMEQLTC